MVMQRQIGAAVTNFATLLLVITIGAMVALNSAVKSVAEQPEKLALSARNELMVRIDALQSCYNKERHWCDVETLKNFGLNTSANSFIADQQVTGENLALTLSLPNAQISSLLADNLPGSRVDGNNLTFEIEPPTRSDILKDQLQRWEDPDFNRNTLENAIYLSANDIPNINNATAKIGRFERLDAQSHTTETLNVSESLQIGGNEIRFADKQININSQMAQLMGGISATGNVSLNDTNIDGINEASSKFTFANNILADSADIADAKGKTIEYTQANIESLSAYKYVSDTFKAQNIRSGQLEAREAQGNVQAVTATVNDIGFVSGTGGTWTYNNSQSQRTETNNAALGVIEGQTLNLQSRLNANHIASTSGRYTSLAVLGSTSGGNFTSANDFSTNSSSVNGNYDTLKSQATSIANNDKAIDSTAGQISSTNAKYNQNVSDMNNNTSRTASNKQNIDTNSGKITSNERGIDSVDQRLTSSAEQLGLWQDRLDKCMYQTQYCIPQTPSANVTCSGCNVSRAISTFNATVQGSVKNCRQGCSYKWETSGSGITYRNCNSGSVGKGGNASPSCSVSASNVGAQKSVSGSVKLVVNNSHYTDKVHSDSTSVNFTNLTDDVVIANEISIDCSNCSKSSSSSRYKGRQDVDAWAVLNHSSKLSGVNISTSLSNLNCTGGMNGLGSASSAPEMSGENTDTVNMAAYMVDGDASAGGMLVCSATVTFTVTASNVSGSGKKTANLAIRIESLSF